METVAVVMAEGMEARTAVGATSASRAPKRVTKMKEIETKQTAVTTAVMRRVALAAKARTLVTA